MSSLSNIKKDIENFAKESNFTELQIVEKLEKYFFNKKVNANLKLYKKGKKKVSEISKANPIQAALASGASFVFGGALPLLVVFFFPLKLLEIYIYASSIIFLIILGAVSAKTGGAKIVNPVARITFWGTIAMGVTALLGYLFGVNL